MQAHAAFPAANEAYVIVANQKGKTVHRILTDSAEWDFALDPTATLVFSCDALGVADSHGGVLTWDSRYLWTK